MNPRIYTVRLRLWLEQFSAKFRRRKFRPIEAMDANALKKAAEEARLLRTQFAVDVQPLAAGEKPEPRPANPD